MHRELLYDTTTRPDLPARRTRVAVAWKPAPPAMSSIMCLTMAAYTTGAATIEDKIAARERINCWQIMCGKPGFHIQEDDYNCEGRKFT